jgi:hypothetical protein
MSIARRSSHFLLAAATGLVFVGLASAAATFTDATGDAEGAPTSSNFGNSTAEDITSVDVSNDATNVTFQINLAAAPPTFAHYDIGISGAGGVTSLTDPFGEGIGNSAGMKYLILGFNFAGTAPNITYGDSFYDGTSGTYVQGTAVTSTGSTAAGSTAAPFFVSFTVPRSQIGSPADGSTITFDAYTSFSSGASSSAVDALNNPNQTFANGSPNGGGTNNAFTSGSTYDSNPAVTPASVNSVYTLTSVPEPASLGMLSLASLALLRRRK